MEISRNEHKHMFEIQDGRLTAVVEYKSFDGGINIIHTFVPKPLQNKGYGSALVKYALEYAKEKNWKVIITCPFARAYIARHKEYESLL